MARASAKRRTILLDNCVPADLAAHIRGHDVSTAVDVGLDTLDDGDLLDAISDRFEVLLTVDKSIPLQQPLSGRPFAVIVLRARSNRVQDLARLIPELQRVLKTIQTGDLLDLGSP